MNLSKTPIYAVAMGNRFDWKGLLGRRRAAVPAEPDGALRAVTSVDTALVIEAARHVVTTRVATTTSLSRHLFVAPAVADQMLARLEHCEVIAGASPGEAHRVLSTSGELPELVVEFQRRC